MGNWRRIYIPLKHKVKYKGEKSETIVLFVLLFMVSDFSPLYCLSFYWWFLTFPQCIVCPSIDGFWLFPIVLSVLLFMVSDFSPLYCLSFYSLGNFVFEGLLINLLTVKEIDHPVNIPTKCGSKWQNGFREENNGRHQGWTTSDGNFSLLRQTSSYF